MSSSVLRPPADRLERELPDKKPLFSDTEAEAEANRCLYCADAPCIKACPTEIDIPTFIKKIASGNVRGSARTIFEQNMLGYSCARVCPVEVLCAGSCVYETWGREPIAIGRLQRYATEKATQAGQQPLFRAKSASGKKVAMIGAGPASLACAAYLALEGHKSVLFEKRPLPGGLNTTGIAPYKLQVDDSLHEVRWLLELGHIEIKSGLEIGKDVRGADLLRDYDAVFIGVGLGEDTKLGVSGEDGPDVFGATAWIEKLKTAPARDGVPPLRGKRVVVVGGGNTAIDVARECAQLGADDTAMLYRRGAADMSGYHHEMEHARLEGVRLIQNAQPVAVVRDDKGNVTALRLAKTDDGKPVAGTEHDLACDFVALAIGQSKLRSVAKELPGVALDARGCVVADAQTGQTGNEKVFAGGDCVNGGKEVVNGVADGRNAARTLIARWSRDDG
jgi:glutamate synthase (NADPH/NADH) small chain